MSHRVEAIRILRQSLGSGLAWLRKKPRAVKDGRTDVSS